MTRLILRVGRKYISWELQALLDQAGEKFSISKTQMKRLIKQNGVEWILDNNITK